MPPSPLPSKAFALPGREEAVRPEVREDVDIGCVFRESTFVRLENPVHGEGELFRPHRACALRHREMLPSQLRSRPWADCPGVDSARKV